MPRYASQNLAVFGAQTTNNSGDRTRRFCYGKGRNVIIVGGKKMLDEGLCLRLLPTYEVDDRGSRLTTAQGQPVLTPFRRQDGSYGDWCRSYECVSWFGQPGLHFIVHDGNPSINRYESPVWVLYQAAYKNKETPGIGPLFVDLLNRAAGFQQQTHVGSLKRPEQILFVSASQVYDRNDRSIGLGCYDLVDQKEGNARIFGFKKTAAESLLNALQVQNDQGQFLAGDMLADPAKLITVISKSYGAALNPKPPRPHGVSIEGPEYVTVPYYAISAQNPNETVILGKVQARPDSKLPPEQHSVVLHDTYNGQRVTLEGYARQLQNDNSTFDELMYIPTFEEQAELMAGSFPKEALDFAWRDHPEYLRFLRGRGATTVEAPRQHYQPQPTPPTGVPQAFAQTATVSAGVARMTPATTTTTDDIDPAAAAAFTQLQQNMAPPAASAVDDVVARARAKSQQQVGAGFTG